MSLKRVLLVVVVALSIVGLVVLFYLFVLPLLESVVDYLPRETSSQGCVREVSWGFAAPFTVECEELSECVEYQAREPKWKEDVCYYHVAGATRDPEICVLIDDQDQREGCFSNVASILKDPHLCDRIDRSSIAGQERYQRCVENASVEGEER